ncbi:MAG: Na/Pi cotransporter family protein [Clostridia bacterium]|nr:Na/Pi cotransporter family protein [Clostridia bacterium]
MFTSLLSAQGMSASEVATSLLMLIAGIGVFLVACKLMSSSLEALGSNKLKALFAKTSKSKLVGVGIGTVATAAIQSSGATTVMVIGFVNAGIMTLAQATTVIMGANIGTTITGQIVALGLFGSSISTTVIFSAFAGIGAFITLFAKKDSIRKIGGILAGFGMLFVGLYLMSSSMEVFAELDAVKTFLASISNPLLLVLIGMVLTAIVQSSSVMTSLAISMVFSGLISLDQGIYLTLGSNIGSCMVTIIAGFGSSTNAKRTALVHLIFNVVGVIVFMLVGMIIRLASKGGVTFGTIFAKMFPNALNTQMAMFHTIFNVVTVILILPLTNLLVKLVTKIIPDKKQPEDANAPRLYYIDEHLLSTPPIAVQQTKNEIVNMAELAMHNFDLSCDIICKIDFSEVENFRNNENQLNFLNKEIVKFIIKLTKLELSESDRKFLSSAFHTITDLERVGDYAENIVEYAENLHAENEKFSEDAIEEIRHMQELIGNLYQEVMKAYVTNDLSVVDDAKEIEESIDDFTDRMQESHIRRLDEGICTSDIGVQFMSLASNAERVADHFMNVAESIQTYAAQPQSNAHSQNAKKAQNKDKFYRGKNSKNKKKHK